MLVDILVICIGKDHAPSLITRGSGSARPRKALCMRPSALLRMTSARPSAVERKTCTGSYRTRVMGRDFAYSESTTTVVDVG